ncbi:arginyl-tRNA synthetase [Sporolactobacillus inulinus]|uniref:arginine--tRNA ligase n=1 Tax=Sporolactobacillus inulinus TaxID=2078 RepID=A0A4Y1Z6Q3_9BACL|nr:arginyl-tRNA synthetase [Sporolactobacillus inulinus]
MLDYLKGKGETYEKDGALWLKTSKYGDDKDRVLVKSDGSYTYFTPDIAYHKDKLDRGFEQLIDVLGADHHGYVPRLKAAIQTLGYNPDQLTVQIIQLVNLFKDGEKVKMSKRTGKAVTMRELMEDVGVDAARYFFAMRSSDSHLDFDLDLAISHSNENPVYYVQYAYARITSMLKRAEAFEQDDLDALDLNLLSGEKEIDLLKKWATSLQLLRKARKILQSSIFRITCSSWRRACTVSTMLKKCWMKRMFHSARREWL